METIWPCGNSSSWESQDAFDLFSRLVCMPQDSHDHARMHIEVDEQRGTYMPGVTNCELTYSRGVAARRELPVESAGINRGAIAAGEDQRRHVVRLLPSRLHSMTINMDRPIVFHHSLVWLLHTAQVTVQASTSTDRHRRS
jgi:hypothetical protein